MRKVLPIPILMVAIIAVAALATTGSFNDPAGPAQAANGTITAMSIDMDPFNPGEDTIAGACDAGNTADEDSDGFVNDGCPTVGSIAEVILAGACDAGNTANNDDWEDSEVNDGCPAVGNTDALVGPRDECARINENDTLDADETSDDTVTFDVTAEGIPSYVDVDPAGYGEEDHGAMLSFSFRLEYDESNLSVQAHDPFVPGIGKIIENAGSTGADASQTLPDPDNGGDQIEDAWTATVSDTGPLPGVAEDGDGVLDRIDISSDTGATAGVYALTVNKDVSAVIDSTNNALAPTTTNDATVAIDQACPEPPQPTDVGVTSVTTTAPANGDAGTPFAVTADVEVSNLSGLDPVKVDTTIELNLSTDCEVVGGDPNPDTEEDTSVSQAGSPVSLTQRSWSVTCTDPSFHDFTTTATVAIDPGEPAFDDTPGNDTDTSAAGTTAVSADADAAVSGVTVGAPTSAGSEVPFTVTADVAVSNLSGLDPVKVDTTITLTLPGDCNTGDTNPVIDQKRSISQGGSPVSIPQQSWSVTCTNTSDHTFTVDATVAVDQTHVSDSTAGNDSDSGQAQVALQTASDVAVTSVTTISPASGDAGTPFAVTADVEVSNVSGQDPVKVDTTIELNLPTDCEVVGGDPNPDTEQDTSVSQAGSPVSLNQRSWSVTCTDPSFHDFTTTATVAIDPGEPAFDPTPDNNSGSDDSDPTAITADVDLKVVGSVSVSGPAAQATVGTAFDVTATATVHNNGPWTPADAKVDLSLNLPPDCDTSDPNPQGQISVNAIPTSTNVPVDATWSVTCDKKSFHDFSGSATIVVNQLHVTDPDDNNNNSGEPVDETIPISAEADVQVSGLTVTAPDTEDVGDDFVVNVDATVHNAGPFGPVMAFPSVQLNLPDDCAASVVPAASSVELPVSTHVQVGGDFTISCDNPSTHVFDADVSVELSGEEEHVLDPTTGNNSLSAVDSTVITADADLKVVSVTVNAPASASADEAFDVTVDASVHNNGPFGPFDTTVTVTFDADDCTVDGDSEASEDLTDLQVSVAAPITQQTFSVTCSSAGEKTFSATVDAETVHIDDGSGDGSDTTTVAAVAAATATPAPTPTPAVASVLQLPTTGGVPGGGAGSGWLATFIAATVVLGLITGAGLYYLRRRSSP